MRDQTLPDGPRDAKRTFVAAAALCCAGCGGAQSVLAPQGAEAARIARLSWVLFGGGMVILLIVVCVSAVAIIGNRAWRDRLATERLVIGGGLLFPIIVLSSLLGYGMWLTRANLASAEQPVTIRVVGEMWWWRVSYVGSDGRRFEGANEVRIPVGRPVSIELETADVIHSFWVPRLAGKVDMIPGRMNRISLRATRPGISRGQCAEYCGGAHALMAFNVIAMPERDFTDWLDHAGRDAPRPSTPGLLRGQQLFITAGCGACHSIRGTEAKGTIGPDLSDLGDRLSLAAGTLPNNEAALAHWIRDNQQIKPQNRMPPFLIFESDELKDLSAYLSSLRFVETGAGDG